MINMDIDRMRKVKYCDSIFSIYGLFQGWSMWERENVCDSAGIQKVFWTIFTGKRCRFFNRNLLEGRVKKKKYIYIYPFIPGIEFGVFSNEEIKAVKCRLSEINVFVVTARNGVSVYHWTLTNVRLMSFTRRQTLISFDL